MQKFTVTLSVSRLNEFAQAFEFNDIETKFLGNMGKSNCQLQVICKSDRQELQFWRICHAQRLHTAVD